MLKKIKGIFSLIIAMLAVYIVYGTGFVSAEPTVGPRMAKEAIKAARDANKYLFLLFYDKKDDLFSKMEETVNSFVKNTDKKVLVYKSSAKDPKDVDIVYKYRIDKAPLPILLVIGPNGAVAGGFPKSVTSEKLERSFMSPMVMDVLKTIQEQKMAIVVLQNSRTKFNAESAKAAQDLSYDKQFLGQVEVIKADPADPANKDFLANAKLTSAMDEAAIVLIAPPGVVAGVYQGNINKNGIISNLSSGGACGGGKCGPGGCS
ncbi:MAG: hypothetical protein KBB52_06905 [Candidatus Omnitrophica bacterium]|nr:hypothetical protein [Candidatus Omnitrophota bacterium]